MARLGELVKILLGDSGITMTSQPTSQAGLAISMLRRMAQPKPQEERCDFCSVAIAPVHRHLLEIEPRKIVCACDPCALRFQDVVGGRYKLVPRDAKWLSDFSLSDAQWNGLMLPINLAFLYRDTRAGRFVAMYPSPAGATESVLTQANWDELERENPALTKMAADVEALLVNRIGQARAYFVAPMDVCFELVGLIRMYWRGFSGGETVWTEIEKYFNALKSRAIPMQNKKEASHA